MEVTGAESNASTGDTSSLIGNDIMWGYGLMNGQGLSGNGSTEPESVMELTVGKRQYVGCHVENGYPMPHITLNVGTLDLLGQATLEQKPTTSTGPAGYEVPQFDQRIDYYFKVTWQYDRRIASCLAENDIKSMGIVASTRLSVKGNTYSSRCVF